MELLVTALTAFVLVAPVELPDKTFVATLVLATRYKPLPVWLGVVAAFAVQCLIAVAAGHLLARLPRLPVALGAALLFAIGAVVLYRGARGSAAQEAQQEARQEQEYDAKAPVGRQGLKAALTSFVVLFTAEWGDLSQLLSAGLVARGSSPVAVFIGSWAALAAVSGLAVLSGRWLLARVRLAYVRYAAAAVCAVLAIVTVVTALHS